ncbi:hypothetical protein JXR93_09360 [bacterium]|nr:hypothetical protein [bacterium]
MKRVIEIADVPILLEYDELFDYMIIDTLGDFFSEKESFKAKINLKYREYWSERVNIPTPQELLNVKFENGDLYFRYFGVDGFLSLESLSGEFYIENSKTPLYFLFRFLYVYLMPKFDALYLHSSAVFNDTVGVLSLGVSEAGKTTFALMSQKEGFSVVHDDLVLIKKIENRFHIIHTPIIIYHMEFAKFDKKILTHMFFLKKSLTNQKTLISKKEFIKRVFRMILSFSEPLDEFYDIYFKITSELYDSIEASILEVFPDNFSMNKIL